MSFLKERSEESVHGESVHLYLLVPVVRAQVQSECKQDESVIHSWGRILRFAQNDNSGLFGQPNMIT